MSSRKKIRVSIVGASGYTGFELVKILLRHPYVTIIKLAVHQNPGIPFSDLYPALKGLCDVICSPIDAPQICAESDLVFFGLPHTTGMAFMPGFLAAGIKVIDLSADYRLNTPETFKAAYGLEHTDPAHLLDFVYGLPEINRARIQTTQAVANPGCFPTGIELALIPALKAGLIESDSIIADSKTGISGGGKTPKPAFHFPECNENISAYKIACHQHEPEIEQELSKVAGKPVDIVFIPHLVPLTRGIFSTIYTRLKRPTTETEILKLYRDFFRAEPFVRVMEPGFPPQIKNVAYTNFCDIGLKVVGDRLILLSVIDNLVKGASGQAVQNMNIMLNIAETTGLL